ncbi:MAG TPA: amino acid adenylation domain-containing protein, partial [Thermoanaerobaculia bacterium]|nr:amino acid adenylation domain-containing protein [Thermoanaerobaculia bacterium]
ENPGQTAVIAPDRSLSYQELDRLSNRVAAWVRSQGAKPNQLVAVVMDKGWQQLAGVLGVLKAGAAYLPIDPDAPQERLFYLLENAEVKVALTTEALASRLEWPPGIAAATVDGSVIAAASDQPLAAAQGPDDIAYVIYTSGSTGKPKGVVIDHRGAVNTILDINRRFGVGAKDRVLALSALSFDLSVYDVFGMLAAGGTVVVPAVRTTPDPQYWLDLVRDQGVTVWNSVPALLELVVEHAELHSQNLGKNLRLALLSGDWIPVTLPDRLRALAPEVEVISLGGATEASIWSIFYPIGEVDKTWKSIPYGRPLANQRFYVLNDIFDEKPVYVTGELFIGGIGLAKGYWRDEEKTRKSFVTHPTTGERLYRTGDLGRMLPNGNIEFLGRDDLQVKVRGFRVELGEIEAVLLQHPGVQTAVVVASGTSSEDRRLVAYIIPSEPEGVRAEDLAALAAESLPDYMVPVAYLDVDHLLAAIRLTELTGHYDVQLAQIGSLGGPARIIVGSGPERLADPAAAFV